MQVCVRRINIPVCFPAAAPTNDSNGCNGTSFDDANDGDDDDDDDEDVSFSNALSKYVPLIYYLHEHLASASRKNFWYNI